jgi:hypothetical protein
MKEIIRGPRRACVEKPGDPFEPLSVAFRRVKARFLSFRSFSLVLLVDPFQFRIIRNRSSHRCGVLSRQ